MGRLKIKAHVQELGYSNTEYSSPPVPPHPHSQVIEMPCVCPARIAYLGPNQGLKLEVCFMKCVLHIFWAILLKCFQLKWKHQIATQDALLFAKSGSLLDSFLLDLQIYAVTPIPESQEVLQREGVPDNIKSFYKVNHIWKFRYDRPFHKGTKDKENEFKVPCRLCHTLPPVCFPESW